MLVPAAALLWLTLCLGLSFLVSLWSAHGMAAFFLAGCVLALIGAAGNAIRYGLQAGRPGGLARMRFSPAAAPGYALMAYLMTELVFERTVSLPHDRYQLLLLAYLVAAAALVDYVVRDIVVRRSGAAS